MQPSEWCKAVIESLLSASLPKESTSETGGHSRGGGGWWTSFHSVSLVLPVCGAAQLGSVTLICCICRLLLKQWRYRSKSTHIDNRGQVQNSHTSKRLFNKPEKDTDNNSLTFSFVNALWAEHLGAASEGCWHQYLQTYNMKWETGCEEGETGRNNNGECKWYVADVHWGERNTIP